MTTLGPPARHIALSLAVIAAIACCASPAGAAQLLHDINQTSTPAGSNPKHLTALGSSTAFVATDAEHGTELWVTDGTPAGTELLADINPGALSSNPQQFVVLGEQVFFSADDGTNGREVWVSDGTAEGTHIVAALAGAFEAIEPLVAFKGRVVLGLSRGDANQLLLGNIQELWFTDGTSAGTQLFADLAKRSGFVRVEPGPLLTVVGERLYFRAADGAGSELWSTDGTSKGTTRVADVRPGVEGSSPELIAVVGDELYFSAHELAHGTELWHVARPGASPRRVTDVKPGAVSSDPQGVALGDSLIFTTQGFGQVGTFGATAGAVQQIAPQALGNSLVSAGSVAYFFVQGATELQLWTTNGSQAQMVKGFGPTIANHVSVTGKAAGTRLVFQVGRVDLNRAEAWVSDGTPGGTVPLDLGPEVEPFPEMESDGDAVYFPAHTYDTPWQISYWRSDGTPAGTTQFASPAETADFKLVQDSLFAVTGDPAVGKELFVSDGTPGSLTLLRDINTRAVTADATFSTATLLNGRILGSHYYFSAFEGGPSFGVLWRTDGTPAGTSVVSADGTFGVLASLGSKLLLSGHTAEAGFEPWVTDGTTVEMLADVRPGTASGLSACSVGLVAGKALFNVFANDASRLYITDGTPGGSGLFEVPALPANYQLCKHGNYGSDLYFPVGDAIWKTDGTEGGTVPVYTHGEPSFFQASNFVESNGLLFYVARVLVGGFTRDQLWRTDGTAGGTQIVLPGVAGSELFAPVALGGATVFFNRVGAALQLYRTDGTAPGTQLLVEYFDQFPRPVPVVLDGRAYYSVTVSGQPRAMYSTDGLTVRQEFVAGAFPPTFAFHGRLLGQVPVIGPVFNPPVRLMASDVTGAMSILADFGQARGVTSGVVQLGDSLLFEADDGIHGRELWSLPNGEPSANDDAARVDPGVATVLNVLTNDGDPDGTLDPTTVVLVQAPSFGTVVVDSVTGNISYTSDAGYAGADEFTYAVRDNDNKLSQPAKVAIVVASPIGPPGGPPLSSGSGGGGPLPAPSLLLLWWAALGRRVARARTH